MEAVSEDEANAEWEAALREANSEEPEVEAQLNPRPSATYEVLKIRKNDRKVRWGDSNWGYRHIEWKPGRTYRSGRLIRTINWSHRYQRQGTTDVFHRRVGRSLNWIFWHRVVYQTRNADDGRDRGVITAYYSREPRACLC